MTRTLLRACLGCGTLVRGKPRCTDCQRAKDKAKAARRPDLHADHAERRRRERAVADHRAIVGDWCPGWAGRPAHLSADLTADHVKEVAKGGSPAGRLVVRCRSCNAARSAHLARRALSALVSDSRSPQGASRTTRRPPNSQLHTVGPPVADGTEGPVVA